MTLELREATAEDQAAVITLWVSCGLVRPWNDPGADFRRALDWAGSAIMVCLDGRSIVGSAMVGFDGHRGWIYYLAVDEAWRGQGLARALLGRCEAWLERRGCPKVELMVREGNPAALAYAKLGWEPQDVSVYGRWLGSHA